MGLLRDHRSLLARLALLAAAAAMLVLLPRLLPAASWLLELAGWLRGHGAPGAATLGLGFAVGFAFFFPGILMSMTAGFVYGPAAGLWLAYPASVAGALVSFLLGRTLLRERFLPMLERYPALAALDHAVAAEGARIVVLLRLTPVVPFAIQNYSLGASRMQLRSLVVGSLVGNGAPALFHAYLGSLATDAARLGTEVGDPAARTAAFWIGFAATGLLVLVATQAARKALAARLSTTPAALER
jgi:uncharacterized membrane protein YdjX (TVP38/TMEM64 family)